MFSAFIGRCPIADGSNDSLSDRWVINSCNWPRVLLFNGHFLRLEPFSITRLHELESMKISLGSKSIATEEGDGYKLQNRYISATVDMVCIELFCLVR